MATDAETVRQAWERAEDVRLMRCRPPHEVRDEALLASLTESLAGGWDGARAPLVGIEIGEEVRLLTGSHRYAAALAIGMDEVPVVLLTDDEYATLCDDSQDTGWDDRRGCIRDTDNAGHVLCKAGHGVVGELVRGEG